MLVYVTLVLVGYAVRVIHENLLLLASPPRHRLELPRATARRTRYQRVLHSLDARDRATWPMVDRIHGEPPC